MKEFVEKIILRNFKEKPFHNFYFKYGIIPSTKKFGGSCSDIVLDLYDQFKSAGLSVSLHSSLINNQETHRVLRMEINGIYYYADVGNGWPSIQLFSETKTTEYSCYGITFKSIRNYDALEIYHIKNNKNTLSVKIPLFSKSESEILNDIDNRYDPQIKYPFSNKIRFSQIIKDDFCFLRDNTLYIYNSKYSSPCIIDLDEKDLCYTLNKYFNFDLDYFLKYHNKIENKI